ncbi:MULTISPECIES: adenylate/guanylate cyclase domain-containing protein [unclassified Ensifer]|uniref:adenylate/guanylate cyclase domain-containing protein n=1 Tax=unclassified Ensifer TaxID=2633371 RepID=UPI0008130923|nr:MULTISPECIES: adenylate/guanylate cyclase domain-containing protein [unclassified Ensifer]OCP00720.1 adenylate cyclase [Ensifer sp. LC14]OCP04579.1 adenylate cyclase [Ensifer sp. LC11]OCP09631.1 adenylate cyclase [Ensifer sp. LC13]OCP30720.1 adenylate cyclase [Ensifer sp. LC499]
MKRRLTTILSADVAGYSRLMGANEAETLAALTAHRAELVDAMVTDHEGRIVKLVGDGMLVEFESVVNAVDCAAKIQKGMRQRNSAVPDDRRIEFRIGVNIGDVIVENDDIFGDGVNIAARIENFAKPGGVAVSAAVREHVGNRLDLVFEDAGEQLLKNIERPVRVYNVVIDVPQAANDPAARGPASARKPSIAVLPFNNMSDDPTQEYFSDGITEDIITDLSKISGLSVVARHTVFVYKGTRVTAQRVAAELGVSFLLEGSVRKAGQRVRITGQLIDGIDGRHIWAERYDRNLTDIFDIQDEITGAIVAQLKIRLLPSERKAIEQAATASVEAYNYWLKGRELFHRMTKSSLQHARRMFTYAAELDADFARAYAGIADCDSFLCGFHGVNIPPDTLLETCAKALERDSTLPEVHASHGYALSTVGRYEEAAAAFKRALALDPNSHEAHYFYARHCFVRSDYEKAVKHYERAAEIRPDDYRSPVLAGLALDRLGQLEKREKLIRIGLERVERSMVLHPESSDSAQLGACVCAALGERDRALELIARVNAIDPEDARACYNNACAYALLGEQELAMELLEQSLPLVSPELHAWILNDSDLDSLRTLPRFQELLKTTR